VEHLLKSSHRPRTVSTPSGPARTRAAPIGCGERLKEAEMSEKGQGATRTADLTDDANITKSVVGVAKGRDVHLTRAAAALVASMIHRSERDPEFDLED